MAKPHRSIGMGGTFDYFHQGHAHFLHHAWQLGNELVIGITSDQLVRSKGWAHSIQSFAHRFRSVKHFCHQHRISAELVELHDGVGPTLERRRVQALCVTPETEKGATYINELRTKLRMRPLPVYVCPFWRTTDGEVLHSLAIRAGQRSQTGTRWLDVLHTSHILTEDQRLFWQAAQGPIVDVPQPSSAIIAVVGDYCLSTFHTHRWQYHLGIFDGKTQREAVSMSTFASVLNLATTMRVTNPAGQISTELVEALMDVLPAEHELDQLSTTPRHVFVEGEEDLAAVALQLLLPLGSTIYYGQREQGMVAMPVTLELKQAFYDQLSANLYRR